MGGIFSSPSPPPVATPDQALADRQKEQDEAKRKAAEINAKAQGRGSLLNPATGALGVSGSEKSPTQTLF